MTKEIGTMAEQFGRVGVLMGGPSSERMISLKSGEAVLKALDACGVDARPVVISNTDPSELRSFLRDLQLDIAFIALHGEFGEDGQVQSLLEDMGISYTGSGPRASAAAMDKAIAREYLNKAGIPVPDGVTVTQKSPQDAFTFFQSLNRRPIVVKPANGGSSIGMSFADSEDELRAALGKAWQYCDQVVLEEMIRGREFTVGIFGNRVLPVIEICSKNRFFDFEAKYKHGRTDYIFPADADSRLEADLTGLSLQAFQELGCRHFGRVDFMTNPDGRIYVLEINTIPGFTETSLVPKAAAEIGVSFDQLCLMLLEMCHASKEKKENFPAGR